MNDLFDHQNVCPYTEEESNTYKKHLSRFVLILLLGCFSSVLAVTPGLAFKQAFALTKQGPQVFPVYA